MQTKSVQMKAVFFAVPAAALYARNARPASCCWGLENNCTRMISGSSPQQIVIVKGIGSGMGVLIMAFVSREAFPAISRIPLVLGLGFVAYGLSSYFFLSAQRHLGAAKISAYHAVAPFIGALLSLLIFRDLPSVLF